METNSKEVLEKQITSMLNNVIGDEEQIEIYDELSFSDENDNDNIFNIQNQDFKIRNTKTHHKINNNFYNDDENLFKIQNQDYQIRNSKTHH